MQSREDAFTKIWKDAEWGHPKSGVYASPNYTRVIRNELPRIIKQYNIATMFDAPCGDYTWMHETKLPEELKYIGGDIVRPLIRDLMEFYPDKDFRVHDLVRHAMPAHVDLWFCRDGLYLLEPKELAYAFRFFQNSGARYFMITSHLNESNTLGYQHADSMLNFCASPFEFPKPLEWVSDWHEDKQRPALAERRMGLWDMSLAPTSLAVSSFVSRFV